MSEVEDAIRAWEAARVIEEEAWSALNTGQVVRAVDRRVRDVAIAWEEETFREAIRLMAQEGKGLVGWIVDGRFYFRVDYDEIRSIVIINNVPGGVCDE